MKPPVFEAVIDHNDPGHHKRIEGLTAELLAWARNHGLTRVEREELEIRPGVVRVRYFPAAQACKPVLQGDRLALSKA